MKLSPDLNRALFEINITTRVSSSSSRDSDTFCQYFPCSLISSIYAAGCKYRNKYLMVLDLII